MSLARRIRRARFETEATLEGFDFTASPKLPAAQIRDLTAAGCRASEWTDVLRLRPLLPLGRIELDLLVLI